MDTPYLLKRKLTKPESPFSFFRKMLIDSASYAVFSALANSLSNFQVAGVFYAGGRLMEQGKVDMVGIFR